MTPNEFLITLVGALAGLVIISNVLVRSKKRPNLHKNILNEMGAPYRTAPPLEIVSKPRKKFTVKFSKTHKIFGNFILSALGILVIGMMWDTDNKLGLKWGLSCSLGMLCLVFFINALVVADTKET